MARSLPISQNTALFSLLGTTYGGDGKSNFALPNLQGTAPMQAGQGPGLSVRDLGETGGETSVTLLTSEISSHSHTALGASPSGDPSPAGHTWGSGLKGHTVDLYAPAGALWS
jgi:microcystin-dependent protein